MGAQASGESTGLAKPDYVAYFSNLWLKLNAVKLRSLQLI